MLVLQRPVIDCDVWIEFHARWSILPAFATELAHLGISLLGQSRILQIDGVGVDTPCHLSPNTPGHEGPGYIVPPHSRCLSGIKAGDAHLGYETLAVLGNPMTEELRAAGPPAETGASGVDVFCHAGVTDAEGDTASLALQLTGTPDVRCHAGFRYRFARPVDPCQRASVERLLGNPLIYRFIWHDRAWAPPGPGSVPTRGKTSIERVQLDDLHAAGEEEPPGTAPRECPVWYPSMSRRLGLALGGVEMGAIGRHFARLGRPATDVELQSIALTWSEHCSHKTFKAPIRFEYAGAPGNGLQSLILGLLSECFVEPARMLNRRWVRSAFVDNAGVIAFDRHHDLAFKVETHNHPSAIEPFGGAHTGVGGVIRDVMAVSAEPIANTNVLCFGPPDLPPDLVPAGVFHPSRTLREVVRGVAEYGNNMGIPTVAGAVLFHPGYTANPLVYCGTLGIAPRDSHPCTPRAGDRIVLLGGRTGRDGLHGATMSSETLDRETVESSAVQIGAPIVEKTLRDVLPHLRDERLYHAITDCGAGGLCSAVGEMGQQLGVDVELDLVPLKYEGLAPWEIWLSEAQERMVLAVDENSRPRLHELCRAYGVEASVIGRFRDDGLLRLTYGGEVVTELEMSFLHAGRPVRVLDAHWEEPSVTPSPVVADRRTGHPLGVVRGQPPAGNAPGPSDMLLRLLALPTIASKEAIIRRFDHEVGAATIGKPLTGNAGPSDAVVLKPLPNSWRGAVLAHGINPLYGRIDPHAMALLAVDEALRNLVAVGGSIDRAALLDNFCWGDVDDPAELGALVRAAQGCKDASLGYRVPFVCGKDSLRNTSIDAGGRHSIPRTLLISALGVLPDVRHCVTMDLKVPGSRLYLLGRTANELGGSHYLMLRGIDAGRVPRVTPRESRRVMRALTRAIRRGLVLSCHDASEGGLSVAAAEMSLAGSLGLELELERVPADTDATEALLFSESAGRFLVEVAEEHADEFERLFAGMACGYSGGTNVTGRFVVRHGERTSIDLPVEDIETAWKSPLSPDFDSSSGAGSRRMLCDGSSSAPLSLIPLPSPQHCSARTPCRATRESALFDSGALAATGPSGHPPRYTTLPLPTQLKHPRAIILAAAGTNCDRETAEACRLAGAAAELVHLNRLLAGEVRLRDFGLLVLPGGFSYGDHLGAGAMLAAVLRHRLLGDLHDFIADGRPVLGICNGFQVLSRLGLLGPVALAPNASGRFECRWQRLRVVESPCPFLRDLDTIDLPIAHSEGRVVAPPGYPLGGLPAILARAPLRYCDNPNGSVADIAAVCNEAGNVLGLMPHPERYVSPYHHPAVVAAGYPLGVGGQPHAPSGGQPLEPHGLTIFRNAVRLAAAV